MPIPNTAKPQYPNVPQAPGVPPLLRQIGSIQNTVVQLIGDAQQILNLFTAPQWGLFTQAGMPVFQSAASSGIIQAVVGAFSAGGQGGGQSVGDVEYRHEYRIATAPQEQGAFLSYNKVSTPYDGRVTYIISGTAAQRTQFLTQVEQVEASLNQFVLVMPEISYNSCDVVHHDLRRTAVKGLTMLAVDIWVEEVRISGVSQFSNTQSASGANQVNGGTVQPQSLTPAQNANIAGNQSVGAAGGLT